MFSDRMWQQLVGFGPEGFPAYARLRFLPDPAYEGQRENDVDIDQDAPTETAQLRAVLQTLTGHTRTPEDCYFCLWDGWGSDIHGGGGVFIADWQTGTVRPGPQIAPAFLRRRCCTDRRWSYRTERNADWRADVMSAA